MKEFSSVIQEMRLRFLFLNFIYFDFVSVLYSFCQDGITVFGSESGPFPLAEAAGVQTQVSLYRSLSAL